MSRLKNCIDIPESKFSNVNNPTRGLQRVWQRLDEGYGSPEMVEFALKQKLSILPRLTNKDNKRLYELCDILSEVEAVKEDEKYAALLSYLDSSAGILPVLKKTASLYPGEVEKPCCKL